MRVLTAEQMRQVDRRAIEELGIPGMVLMENAAIGLADAIGESFAEAETVAILCGPGNNGGDGLALARHLEGRGYRFRVFLVLRSSEPSGDAELQLQILERSGIEVERILPDGDLASVLASCEGADLVVDALFGTGLSRPLEGHFAELVDGLGSVTTPILAVDIASGLDGSSGQVSACHLSAQMTVTFGAPKVAHVLGPAAGAMGELVVTDLGVPSFVIDEAPGELHLLLRHELAACLLPRSPRGHKGTFGHALVVAGSPGKGGAAVLASAAAVRSGAGLVTAAVPESLLMMVDGASLESMTLALPWDPDGGWTEAALGAVLDAAQGKDAVALGPGLSLLGNTAALVRRLAVQVSLPLVLDADALNAFDSSLPEPDGTDAADVAPSSSTLRLSTLRLSTLRQRSAPTVLTPHPGEMARLLGISTAEVEGDRLTAVRRAATLSQAVVLLKGHRSLIADPTGGVWINPTGNVALATGGSGDVLTGLLVGLLAQGYDALVAAQLAAFLHGLAADLWVRQRSPECLRASDLIETLEAAFTELRRR